MQHGFHLKQMSGDLSLFEIKMLRYIFGAKQENKTWRKRYNYELCMYQTLLITSKLKDWHGQGT
jgi:hypothetical protein